MRTFTNEQYQELSKRFNKMFFIEKIKFLKSNSDILMLASDGNCFRVRLKDEDIAEDIRDSIHFAIEEEWSSSEIHSLLYLLNLETTDL